MYEPKNVKLVNEMFPMFKTGLVLNIFFTVAYKSYDLWTLLDIFSKASSVQAQTRLTGEKGAIMTPLLEKSQTKKN